MVYAPPIKPVSRGICLLLALVAGPALGADDPGDVNPLVDEPLSAIELSNRLIRQSDAYLADIGRLESLYGPLDPVLLEPLQSLTNTMIDRRDYETARELLERRIQIVRIEQGLDSLAQIPLLEEAITNDIRLRAWTDVTDRFEHILLLMKGNSDQLRLELVEQARDIRHWYLHAILLDNPELWAVQGNRIGTLQFQIMEDADALFEENPDALVPWLYQDAIDEFRSVVVRQIRGRLGKAPGIILVEKMFRDSDQSIANVFINLRRMRNIFAEQGDLEAEAMAMIYHADFRLITSKGSASALYRGAMDKLAEAGIAQAEIDRFFSNPVVIPVQEFHRSLEAAMAARQDAGHALVQPVSAVQDGPVDYTLGDFYAWHAYLPGVERPPLPEQAANLVQAYETVQVAFSVNSRGHGRRIEVTGSSNGNTQDEVDAIRSVKAMRFRPRFVERRWKRSDGLSLNYHFPSEPNTTRIVSN